METAWVGSSPRVRGKRALDQAKQKNDRLIPARAGKTPHGEGSFYQRAAHPRACGENTINRLGPGTLVGSSPRVRGKPSIP